MNSEFSYISFLTKLPRVKHTLVLHPRKGQFLITQCDKTVAKELFDSSLKPQNHDIYETEDYPNVPAEALILTQHIPAFKWILLTNLGGGTVKFKLLRFTSWPFCAQATRRKAT